MANQDQNLIYGWANQKLGATAGQSGFAQPAPVPATANVASAVQVTGGNPSPPGAMNVQGENSGAYGAQILTNPGYAPGNGTILGAITAPAVPATTVAVQNPTGLAAVVTIIGGTVTLVSTAPWAVNSGAATFVAVSPGETATETQVTVPGGGFIKMTYSSAPTWSWVSTN